MKKAAKYIRVLTISPIMVIMFLLFLFFIQNDYFKNNYHYLMVMITLVILPISAYPIQSKFHLIKEGDSRANERKLAIIFSLIGYLMGFVLSLLLKSPVTEKVFYLTYLFSGFLIFLSPYLFKGNASGHMAGVCGPVTMIVLSFGYQYIFLYLLVILVIWSSLKLKRHTWYELILGALIPVVSFLLASLLF